MKEACICITNKPANFERNAVFKAGIAKYFEEVKFCGFLAETFYV